jgi:hypothetical protein
MEIINGKWVSSSREPVNNFNYNEFKRLKDSLSTSFGEDITYDKINLMSYVLRDKDSVSKLSKIVDNKEILNKL